MADSGTEAIQRALTQLGRLGKARIKSFISSGTLRRALTYRRVGTELYFTVPHYWAVYYHDGRGPISAKPGKKLVYFVNPKNDPRIATGYPVTRGQIKRLTRQEFYDGVRINRQMYKENPEGGYQQYMRIVDSVGPAVGEPFFKLGLVGFEQQVRKTILKEMKTSISLGESRTKRFTAKIKLF